MMTDLDWLCIEVFNLINIGTHEFEAIDAVVLTNDLTPGEKRGLIHIVHQRLKCTGSS